MNIPGEIDSLNRFNIFNVSQINKTRVIFKDINYITLSFNNV